MSPTNLNPSGCLNTRLVDSAPDDTQECLSQCMNAGAAICGVLVYSGADQCYGYASCDHRGNSLDSSQSAEWYVNGGQCPGGGVAQAASSLKRHDSAKKMQKK